MKRTKTLPVSTSSLERYALTDEFNDIGTLSNLVAIVGHCILGFTRGDDDARDDMWLLRVDSRELECDTISDQEADNDVVAIDLVAIGSVVLVDDRSEGRTEGDTSLGSDGSIRKANGFDLGDAVELVQNERVSATASVIDPSGVDDLLATAATRASTTAATAAGATCATAASATAIGVIRRRGSHGTGRLAKPTGIAERFADEVLSRSSGGTRSSAATATGTRGSSATAAAGRAAASGRATTISRAGCGVNGQAFDSIGRAELGNHASAGIKECNANQGIFCRADSRLR